MATSLYVTAYVLAYVTFAVAMVSSFARLYSRALVVKSWGWDDSAFCVVLLDEMINIVHQVILQLFLDLGCGKPGNVDCSFASADLMRTAFMEEIVIYAAHAVIKITFLLFYMRLSPEYPFRLFIFIGFGLLFSVFISSLLLTVLQCIPFEKILNPMLHPEVTCVDTRTVMLAPPIMNIAMDFYIICIPIATVMNLQMSFRRKLTVLVVLAFGIVSVTVAIIRLPVLVSVTSMKTDASIDVGKMVIVAAFEVQSAVIAVNLPSLKPLWVKFKGRGSTLDNVNPEPSSQGGYKLSSMDANRSKKNKPMGVITRLERGLDANESEEELVEEVKTQSRIRATEQSNGRGSEQQPPWSE
ncbi:hypothetical protein F66182_3297 [Fusarium sp. NRRL 66182]|nr:hypothetical protein F66182_3297 [Fusarium sp. NRRL 66182]